MPAPQRKPGTRGNSKDQTWLRAFWIVLILGAVISSSVVAWYVFKPGQAQSLNQDAYVSVNVKTVVGDSRNVQCKLKLAIRPDREEELAAYQPLLQATVSEALSNAYAERNGPPPNDDIPILLRSAINDKLPRHLRVKEVLVQHLLYGL